MGDVGDVDLQLEVAVVEAADGDGIVEVARGFAVDGDDGEIAEVASGAGFGRVDDGLNRLCCGQDFWRKAVRQMEFANDDFDVYAEVVLVAEDLDDFATGILSGAGPVGDFDVDYYVFKVVPGGAAGGSFA